MKFDITFVPNGEYPSSKIRAEQIAERIGANVGNDLSGSNKVVFVKCWPNKESRHVLSCFRPEDVFVDLVDSSSNLAEICMNAEVNLIVINDIAKDYISCRVINPVHVIPEHHCNFDNEVRTRTIVDTVGYVGSKDCIDLDLPELSRTLALNKLKLNTLFVDGLSVTREDVVEFYKTIDIQLSFRLPRLIQCMPPELKNALKLCNAGSFKIPTVGYPELCWGEFKDCYIEAKTPAKVVEACCQLRDDKELYRLVSCNMYYRAQDYHIDNVVKSYENVLNEN